MSIFITVILLIWVVLIQLKVNDLEEKILAMKVAKLKNTHHQTAAKIVAVKKDPELNLSLQSDRPNSIKRNRSTGPSKIPKKSAPFSLEDFLGGKIFSILGIISIILAIGFFSIWAINNGWIGNGGQILFGIVVSLSVLCVGEYLRPKYPEHFDKISAIGIAGLIVVTYIARGHYDIITPNQAFFAFILEVSLGLFLTFRYNSRLLGTASVVGGLLAPILISSGSGNAVGLLAFLAVLTSAGFVLSSKKNWPEISWILFGGIMFFESIIFQKDQLAERPFVFLGFITLLHLLIIGGSIVRALSKKFRKTTSDINNLSSNEAVEILLLISAILGGNVLGYMIFESQDWNHFGLVLLGQAAVFGLTSIWSKQKKLTLYQPIILALTVSSFVIGSMLELKDYNPIVPFITFMAEALVLVFCARAYKVQLFDVFAKIIVVIGFFWLISINDNFGSNAFANSTIATGIFIGSCLAVGNFKPKQDNLWFILPVIFSSIALYVWNFSQLSEQLTNTHTYAKFIIPSIWSVSLAYSVTKTKNIISCHTGLIGMILLNLILFSVISGAIYQDQYILTALAALIIVLTANFATLSSYFVEAKNFRATDTVRVQATIATLAASTLAILIFGSQYLDEPVRTIIWSLWGIILFGLGIKNNWPHFRQFGIGVFMFLIAKIYLVDVWDWETPIRFIAFLSLGIGLLGISFFYAKKK